MGVAQLDAAGLGTGDGTKLAQLAVAGATGVGGGTWATPGIPGPVTNHGFEAGVLFGRSAVGHDMCAALGGGGGR